MKNPFRSLCAGLALTVVALHAPAATCEDPRPLRLALVPLKDPTTQLAQYRPLIRQLEIALDRRIETVPATSYGAVIEGLLAGGIDLAELGPASYAIAMHRGAHIAPIASFRLRAGPATDSTTSYYPLLITRRAAGLTSLEGLRGTTLSLTDPASTSGALLPRKAIQQLTGTPLDSYFQRVTFAGSHDRAIDTVQKGLVDAAFVSSTSVDEAIRRGRLRMEDLHTLWKSNPIPYDPFVHRTQLCPALVVKIRQVFLGDVSALQGMFKDLGMTGFVPVSDAQYREIRALFPSRP
ncbi:phosphate/phosphite/phosphonate ABC transporter substrate-binding protein [Acidovorax sp. SRB_24]|uniref:phosphate/phosphite/phosphonate ABC transporter substrate-binding protein n=1 Tax=Acidovorax sp. SRB_24 TaxID=1962700 RepID=UPI00145E7CAA|nr:phosphate/phosphite/phosphonate ABC transporter substrate-binding protein [Acidovorax sp. SRB_24]NMM75808.1 hypothetical protein [Acidovorax sp. SRB_24]